MFRRELLTVTTLAVVIFLAVAATGWFAVRELQETSRMLVVDTLPGLVDAGLAGERMHDNRHTMREILAPHSAGERMQMIDTVRTNSTESLWSDYAVSIFESEDRQNYQAMLVIRSNYIQGCEQFFSLVISGKNDEATALFSGDLSRQFQNYNGTVKKLLDYNVRQGMRRAQVIRNTSRYAPWMISGLCVLVFLLGLVLGLRSALSGGK